MNTVNMNAVNNGLERVYFEKFFEYADPIVRDIDNVFYMKNKSTGEVEACYLWIGPSCIYGETPLIHNESIVYGVTNAPYALCPKEFVENYEFCTYGNHGLDIDYGSLRHKNMLKAKELVEAAAQRATA